ncbi:MAG TPA: amidohydrolase family protein, partial [Candidatus Acidoferrales bacterium]|nr:amidohydrolase family protein [Candidatus Acidoferrales bacterium]
MRKVPAGPKPKDVLITGCAELITLRGAAPRRGHALGDLGVIRDGALLIRDGHIAAVGRRRRVENLRESRRARKIDLGGRVVLPGFVDAHTHLVHAVARAAEYEQRISGATYEEIARAGGGIHNSAQKLRGASSG